MLIYKDIERYSLSDIYEVENEVLRNQLLAERAQMLQDLAQDRITRQIILANREQSIQKIVEEIDNAYLAHTSFLYFPENICCFYPKIAEVKAKSLRTCDISGSLIFPNSHYYVYRPLIDNLTTGKTYVLKRSIQAELSYYDFFPQTLYDLENLTLKLGNPYELEDSDYNYYQLSKRLGEYLPLQELRKKG